MDRRSHNRFCKTLFPHLKMSTIDNANSAIDNPSRLQRYRYRKFFGSNELPHPIQGALGVDARGHRRYNHDLVGGFLACFEIDPKHAMELFMSHIILDRISDNIRNTAGSDKRDLIQSLMNINYTD